MNPLDTLTSADVIRADPEVWFCQHGVLKDKSGRVVKSPEITPRVTQRKLFEAYRECQRQRKPCLMMLVKSRQDGGSSGAQALINHHLRRHKNLNGALMGDIQGTSDKVFEIFRYFSRNDNFQWGSTITTDNDDDVEFSNGSHYGKETAMSKNAGRSGTIQVMDGTEVAFFPRGERDPALAFLNSLSTESYTTLGIMDTTPNGPSGTFYKYWIEKDNGWIKIFVPWFSEPDYVRAFENKDEREEFERNLSDDERQEQKQFTLSLEQMNWRRRIIKVKCDSDPDKFRQEYPSDPVSCFFRSTRFRFNIKNVSQMEKIAESVKPQRGEFTLLDDMRSAFVPDDAGSVEIVEPPMIGCRYLGVADSMTGEDQVVDKPQADPDYHSLGIIRAGWRDTRGFWHCPRLVCHHWSRLEIYVASNIMASMSIYYGRCVVFPEVNNCGLTMVKKLNEIGIPIYTRRFTNRTAGTSDKELGWKTDESTRKLVIDFLAQQLNEWKLEEPTIDIPFSWVVGQMRTFILTKNGRPEAMSGTHDDGVMMSAIGFYNAPQAATEYKEHRRKIDIQKVRASGGWQMG
jgi:hypothetical protein